MGDISAPISRRSSRRKVHFDNPLKTTKHRATTLRMLSDLTDIFGELAAPVGIGWSQDDTIALLAVRAGYGDFVAEGENRDRVAKLEAHYGRR